MLVRVTIRITTEVKNSACCQRLLHKSTLLALIVYLNCWRWNNQRCTYLMFQAMKMLFESRSSASADNRRIERWSHQVCQDKIKYTFICIRGLHYGCIIKSLCVLYGQYSWLRSQVFTFVFVSYLIILHAKYDKIFSGGYPLMNKKLKFSWPCLR